ncbi:flavin reductase family protein [Pyrobaculum neutrophilum]|uniref:Flavin reductase domain protein FMN-binding n=1 Tax=Pyrobaculum neutrophilum (strain DSM 2338 / JCM 9278 / NBRC 100436 / V24Sta) TaxID=444157 RepID=B1Y934_PYRNV|nr:flavin reductase domain protein FMN-binding [Pyrobaculum neutrophilum V24Sta]
MSINVACENSPLPTPVLVVVVADHGAVVGWPLVIPGEPPTVAIPLHKNRKTLELIRRHRVFSVNLVKDADRAYEVFGKPGERKLERWGSVAPCRALPCLTLGDASRAVECLYQGEHDVGDHVIVFCSAVASYGCGDYAVWDPCRRR